MKTYNIEQIRKYILSKGDSLGDVAHFLSEEAIDKANEPKTVEEEDMKNGYLYPGHEMWDDSDNPPII